MRHSYGEAIDMVHGTTELLVCAAAAASLTLAVEAWGQLHDRPGAMVLLDARRLAEARKTGLEF